MTIINKKTLKRLKIVLPLLYLIIVILFINIRVDLNANTILIKADLQGTYLPPMIDLNTGQGFDEEFVDPGQIIPELNNGQLKSFRFVIEQQPLLEGSKFLLTDYQIKDSIEISQWEAALPTFKYQPNNTESLILKTSDTNSEYQLHLGQTEWQIFENGDFLIAQNPGQSTNPSGVIRITKIQSNNDITIDIRDLTLNIQTITDLSQDTPPCKIESISFVKNFGRLGIKIPIKDWEAGEILEDFQTTDPNQTLRTDNGLLLIEPGSTPHLILSYKGSLTDVLNETSTTARNYLLILNLIGIVSAFVVFIVLKILFKLLLKNKQQMNSIVKTVSKKISLTVKNILNNKPIKPLILRKVLLTLILILVLGSIIASFLGTLQSLVFILSISALTILWIVTSRLFPNQRWVKGVKTFFTGFLKRDKLLLIILLLIASFLLFYKLGAHDFLEDEFQVVNTAAGYLHSGDYYEWDWINQQITNRPYERAWPHTWLIAQSFKFFGISEWSARATSAFSGFVFIIILYFIARYFTDRHIALLSLFSVIFYITFLNIFRYTRMYALLIPFFLILSYCIYRGLTGEWWIKTKIKFIDDILNQYLNFDYRFLILTLPIMYLNYHIHLNSLFIILAGYIFICLMAILEKSKKYIILTITGVISIIGLYVVNKYSLISNMPWVLGLISFFKQSNTSYIDYLLRHPLGTGTSILLLIYLFIKILNKKTQRDKQHKYLFLFVIIFSASIFFTYIADRYPSLYYVSHIIPIALILISAGLWHLLENFPKYKIVLTIFFLVLILFNFSTNLSAFYSWERDYGNFSIAFQDIIDNYKYDEEVIIGQYLRLYYLQPLDKIQYVSMLNYQQYTFSQFQKDLEKYEAGWITWETRKAYHIDEKIRNFIDTHFQKIHGAGVDDTRVEVYYFSNTSIHNESFE